MSEGWISLHRGWRNNPIFRGEFSRADAWVWLIESASWKPTRTRIKGETVELARGELTFSQRFLAEKWGWSKSRVDRFIAELRQESMIETRSKIGATAGHNAGQGQCIITICNYAKYQDVAQPKRGNDSVEIGATAGQQRGKEEQGNKGTRNKTAAKATVIPTGSRAHSLPDGWQPILTERAQMIVDGWPPGMFDAELAKFRDHASDKGRTSKDWQAGFRTWITNAEKWSKPNGQAKPDKRNGIARALDHRLGLGDFAGTLDRRAVGDGQTGSGCTPALPAPLR